MALTVTAIDKAKPTDKQYRMPDDRGLVLLVRPNGAKLWQLRFRHDGKEKTASLGQYPDVTLAQARVKRDKARELVAAGSDPVAVKKAERTAKTEAHINNFEAIAREWWAHWKATRSESHTGYVIRRLEADVFPAIGTRPISEIEAPELVRMVKTVAQRGALDIAKRCLQMCNQIFRYAIAHGKAARNPAADIKPGDILPARTKENYARIDAKELPALLRKMEGYQGRPTTRLALKLMALTFVRTTELIEARWAEFDLQAARWDIPAERMKMKTPHTVPLSTQAVQVLHVLQEISGGRALLFPGERDHDKAMSNNTLLKALDIMGYKHRMTGHGFRGIASTVLHEQGYDHAHIELQLAHTDRGSVSAAYNHALYMKQRATMMQGWGDYLEGLARGNVVALHGRAA